MNSAVERGGYLLRNPRQIPKRHAALFGFFAVFLLLLCNLSWPDHSKSISTLPSQDLMDVAQTKKFYLKNPIEPPYKNKFWEVGERAKHLGHWIGASDAFPPDSRQGIDSSITAETISQNLFPFLLNSTGNSESVTPLADLRKSYKPGSRGIIIPVGGGKQSVRYACHLIVSLRHVLHTKLPIQIAYAGDEDLPPEHRAMIQGLRGATDMEFLNVLSVFNDKTLKLQGGGWAIKPFALLASRFEKAILIDADAVFLQKPEILFDHKPFIEKGAYLFHDRLLWKDRFPERHSWWKDQIKEPSPEMPKSKAWADHYGEECDSGVVVVDKSRIPVFVGLLHVAWQNTHNVRNDVTYKYGHGDKESWWLGFELSGSTYEFETHYGSIIGWGDSPVVKNVKMVCSFVIAHLDTRHRLLWYNGGLLENKRADLNKYRLPSYWMTGGKWEKGRTQEDMSCMHNGTVYSLTDTEKTILGESIDMAKEVDKAFARH
ncbi:hypothetical protein NW768_005319 [Fusarium equiseti]|uniref:Alpha-1,3-mannosyltransferase n=1 Tax=Fusarium equiseti TaxID=61235 RepID=A0ABQ8RF04_FUSEQ|nr:hypothetical protein NW768_005319 [Fusarium equiseti]